MHYPPSFRLAFFFLFSLVLAPSSLTAQPYQVVPLAPLPAFEQVFVTDINNRLQVVGRMLGSGGGNTFLWDAVNGIRPLGFETEVDGPFIDDAGVIYGLRRLADHSSRAYRWVNGQLFDLPTPPGLTVNGITKVTSNGIVLMRAEAWTLPWGYYAGGLYDLTALTGGATVLTVNEQGMLAGCKDGVPWIGLLDGRSFFPSMTRCVTLLGASAHFAAPQDDQCGICTDNPAYFGRPDGSVSVLATSSPPYLKVVDLNRAGALVGFTHSPDYTQHTPFLYRDGRMIGLNDAVRASTLRIDYPHAINDSGFIVAIGSTPGGPGVSLLLVPTAPDPPSGVAFTMSGRAVTVHWNASLGALSYVLEAGTAAGLSNLSVGDVGAGPSFTATVPGGRYFVRVRARNDAGVSAASPDIVIDVP